MRKILLIIGSVLLMGAAGPAGCDDVAAALRARAIQICGYEPAAETIANLLAAGSTTQTIEGLARAICAAVAPGVGPAPAAGLRVSRAPMAKRAPMVNGVPIRGRFIK